MAAKIIVTAHKGGSRIALVGSSGTELLTSKVFNEPRAKGATLRSLKGMLGEEVSIEDHTVTSLRGRPQTGDPVPNGKGRKVAEKPARRNVSRRRAVAAK